MKFYIYKNYFSFLYDGKNVYVFLFTIVQSKV